VSYILLLQHFECLQFYITVYCAFSMNILMMMMVVVALGLSMGYEHFGRRSFLDNSGHIVTVDPRPVNERISNE